MNRALAYRVYALIALAALLLGCRESSPAPTTSQPASAASVPPKATFVGSATCAMCHADQHKAWTDSHHDLAMQEATDETVLGDFTGATFDDHGRITTFGKKDSKFVVTTDGPDGKLREYPVAYTFGVSPLQQYLLPIDGGRLQALSIAWDSRPKEAGGQRWFHLYPDENVDHLDELHWTKPSQNWNYTCADCHSTNLQKNYDLASNTYDTKWSEINVACEACHGPGSRHVEWAQRAAASDGQYAENDQKGLEIVFDDRRGIGWEIDPKTGNGVRSAPVTTRKEIETCARCHARVTPIWDEFEYGHPILDSRLTTLLEEELYFADGQNRGEVYEYRSYLQSKMYHQGVTCSDCHDPHSLTLRGTGNSVCASCHAVERFDTPAHHFHEADSPGAQCVACHMPERTYMVIDKRRGHAIRIPRPDLSIRLGSPNACNLCHTDQTNEWADQAMAKWYGPARKAGPHYGDAIQMGREGFPGAERSLASLATMTDMPGIVRATALSLLGRFVTEDTEYAVEGGLRAGDPIVRIGAVRAARGLPGERQMRLLFPLIGDAVRAVRLEAIEVIAALPQDALTPLQRAALGRAAEEYRRSRLAAAEQPGSHVDIGNLERGLGRIDAAEAAYQTALRLDDRYAPAYVNLADLKRAGGDDKSAETILREGLVRIPRNPDLHFAMGLLRVRGANTRQGLESLAKAVELHPDQSHYVYVYAVALDAEGRTDEALDVLRRSHERRPRERELLSGLISICHQRRRFEEALDYARRLADLVPGDAQVLQVVESLTHQLGEQSSNP